MKKTLKTRIGAIVLTGCIMTTTFLAVPASVVPVEAKTKYVYIAASGNGTKYHNNKECSRMRGKVKKVKLSKAKKDGYEACKKCYEK